MTIAKTTTAALTGIALSAASSVALAAPQPEGIYSADQLLDADVYVQNADKKVGEIEDIILDNDMTIKSFIVEAGGHFSLGGKSYVVDPNQLSVSSESGSDLTDPDYRVTLDTSAKNLQNLPVYDDAWWTKAQKQAQQAWNQTKQTAGSAWTNFKQGTSNIVDSIGNATGNAVDATGNALGAAADKTGNAADAAVEQTGDAANATADAAGNAAGATGDAVDDTADATGDAAQDATN